MAFGQFLENLRKSRKSGRKSLENLQKRCYQYVYTRKNNTWLLVDIEYLFMNMFNSIPYSFAALTHEILS